MKHNFRLLGAFLLFVFLCVSCSDNTKPRQSDALEQMSDPLGFNDQNEVMKLSSLSNEHGFVKDQNSYTVTARWDMTFLKSANDLENLADKTNGEAGIGMAFGVAAFAIKFGDFKAGDVFHCSNEFPFLRTEKGWIVQKPASDPTCTKQSQKDVDIGHRQTTTTEPERTKASSDIAEIKTALDRCSLDNASYPTAQQGLRALVSRPSAGSLPKELQALGRQSFAA